MDTYAIISMRFIKNARLCFLIKGERDCD